MDMAQRGERDLPAEPLAQLPRQVGHLLVGARTAGGPFPHLARAEARLLGRVEPLVKQSQVHRRKSLRYGALDPCRPGKG
jgi:hypothetical protein